MNVNAVSVLICTYNRAAHLREALAALSDMTPPHECDVEIVVVDNNSTDNTPRVIADAARCSRFPIVALHETRQGKGFALNRGLEVLRGDVVALTDDDVWPDGEWLRRIVERFRERDVTFVFGKVLPRWGALPPPELLTTRAQCIWGPLALVDYYPEPTEYLPGNTGQRLPIGANMAVTRAALVAIGGWRADLGKVDNTLTSGEDHEVFCRLRRLDLYRGLYDPDILVRHYVPARRLTRQYFREWFFWSGKTHALMLGDLYPDLDLTHSMRIGGLPRFLWRQSFQQLLRWFAACRPGTPALEVLIQELLVWQHCGLIVGCWKRRHRAAAELAPRS